MSSFKELTGTPISRRTFASGAAAGAAALAFSPLLRAGAQNATPAGGAPEAELEIFSWWTTAGEAAGLQELFKAFSEASPSVKVINAAVAGGAGTNAQVALQTRLSANQPPDSWQSHTGAELKARYVDPGYTQPITSLYDEQKWNGVFSKGVLDQISVGGEKYLVPVGVHRGNGMFYNKKLITDNGIEVKDTWTSDQFFAAADKLKKAGIPAVALGSKDTFAVVMLFENTLLGSLGPADYNKIWKGEVDWGDARVTDAIERLAKYFDYVNSDHAALTWDGGADELYAGKSAFMSMGDWMYGDALAKKQQDAIAWTNHPSTAGSFVTIIDGFTMPKGAPHPINAKNWLIAAGSAKAQSAFAPHKGAIPARSDADTSAFNDYMKWSAASFAKDTVCLSLAHGSAASPQFATSINDAIISFVVDLDVKSFQKALKTAQADEK
ncbi:MAG: ABC transporter substrate-binding protein [Thermomicrobiales bacterium]